MDFVVDLKRRNGKIGYKNKKKKGKRFLEYESNS